METENPTNRIDRVSERRSIDRRYTAHFSTCNSCTCTVWDDVTWTPPGVSIDRNGDNEDNEDGCPRTTVVASIVCSF